MFEKKRLGIISLALVTVIATGCGSSFPELTEEEYNHTVEYAAGLLMRYSNNGQERLIYVDAKEVEKQREKEVAKAAEQGGAKEETKPKPAPAPEPETEPEPIPEPDDTVEEQDQTADNGATEDVSGTDNTETTENTEDTGTQTTASDPSAITLSSEETQEIIDDIFLSYQGYMVSSTYPESSKSYVVNADKGKKLLVLRFDLYNASGSSKQVNMIPMNMMFQVILNGRNLGYSSVTFLPNDLASYSGTIDSKAHESVVVLTQIKESETTSIESLGMIVTMKGQNQSVNLK
jgi:hypothetical protein